MYRFVVYFALLWLCFVSDVCIAKFCMHTDNSLNCVKYLHNFDGDTFTVDIPDIHPFFGNSIAIRILGVNTAEIGSTDDCERKAALLARQRTQELLSKAKRIDLVEIKKDKYFRVLSRTMLDTTIDLGQILLNEKLAVPYDGGTKKKHDWCSVVTLIKKTN